MIPAIERGRGVWARRQSKKKTPSVNLYVGIHFGDGELAPPVIVIAALSAVVFHPRSTAAA